MAYNTDVKDVIKKLLSHYKNKDDRKNEKYNYFTFSEKITDSKKASKFENLSIKKKIVLKTRLNYNDSFIVLRLFKCLFEKDFFIINDKRYIYDIYSKYVSNDTTFDEISKWYMIDNKKLVNWIVYLNTLIDNCTLNDNENIIDLLYKYESLSNEIEKSTVYTIDDILESYF